MIRTGRWGAPLLAGVAVLAVDCPARDRFVEIVPAPTTLLLDSPAAPFAGSGRPDVAVHIPRGFDASRRPSLFVYFHGWNGCVAVAVGEDDAPCTDGGPARLASRLGSQLDDANVNAMLVAVETRADMPTGEVGDLERPGALRRLLNAVLREGVAPTVGAIVDVDAFDRVVVVAHSGGYQGAAAALRFGELPHLAGVVLLDAFYGADDIFLGALHDPSMRFVDLYTYSGGTLDRSLRAASEARALEPSPRTSFVDDAAVELMDEAFSRSIVIARVDHPHAELPRIYARAIFSHASSLPP